MEPRFQQVPAELQSNVRVPTQFGLELVVFFPIQLERRDDRVHPQAVIENFRDEYGGSGSQNSPHLRKDLYRIRDMFKHPA